MLIETEWDGNSVVTVTDKTTLAPRSRLQSRLVSHIRHIVSAIVTSAYAQSRPYLQVLYVCFLVLLLPLLLLFFVAVVVVLRILDYGPQRLKKIK